MARVLLLLLGLVATLVAAATASELHLPADIYDNAAGEWSVEVLSACRAPLLGSVTFLNTTAQVQWQDATAPEMRISGQPTKAALSAAALAEFMTKDGREYLYSVCDQQENYLATPQRPTQQSGMLTTYVKTYSGVLRGDGEGDACDGAAERNVAVYAVGAPLRPSAGKDWRMQEALYVIEVVIETKNVAATCASKHGAAAADAAQEGKKRQRKRRAHRTLSTGAVVSQADEMVMENGVVTLRFVRRTVAHQPWYLRFYSPLMFATIFIIYRVVHTFSSTRAAKSSP